MICDIQIMRKIDPSYNDNGNRNNNTMSMLSIQGVSLPATQSLLNYACLALIYGTCLIIRRQKIQEAWWKYACLSLSECIATFSLVTAYRFTSLTSVTLLGCFSIPCKSVLTISWIKTCMLLGIYIFSMSSFRRQ